MSASGGGNGEGAGGSYIWDPRHYDLITQGYFADFPFYLRNVRRSGAPVLELGCGTGRVALALAAEGLEVWGLDIAEPMVSYARERARERGLSLNLSVADCRTFDLGRRFRTVIFPYNGLQLLLGHGDLEACLERVRAHLEPDGRFLLDVFNPDLDLLNRRPGEFQTLHEYEDPDGGGLVRVAESQFYDRARQVSRLTWAFRIGKKEHRELLEIRVLFPQELQSFLHYNGFEIESLEGDYAGAPFSSGAAKQILVTRLRQ